MSRRTRYRDTGWTPWILALVIAVVMVPMHWLIGRLGLYARRDGFGQHPWGVTVFAVVVPSVVLVSFGYELWGRWQSRRPDEKEPTEPAPLAPVQATVPEEALVGEVRTRFDSPEPSAEQLERRARSIAILRELGVPVLDDLPVVETEESIRTRSAEEIAQRTLATLIAAVRGETQEPVNDLLERFHAEEFLSPAEREFIEGDASDQDFVNFRWRYECVHVFLWALKRIDTLQAPNEICDVATEVGIVSTAGHALVGDAELRPMSEILDMADLYYRLDWAAVELRVHNESSAALDDGIVVERHRALNWLIRHLDRSWDDVRTDS